MKVEYKQVSRSLYEVMEKTLPIHGNITETYLDTVFHLYKMGGGRRLYFALLQSKDLRTITVELRTALEPEEEFLFLKEFDEFERVLKQLGLAENLVLNIYRKEPWP